jgi:asparagine synthase (glutamine-hydrolysing)
MPGITGIIAKHFGAEQKAALQQMVKGTEHEPFYVSGRYVNETVGVGIGWTNHQDTFSDCLPIWNERGDVGLFFTGEHFGDHQNALAGLRAKGHACEAPNASYLIHLYEEQGLDSFLAGLNGWFSGVLLDLRDGKVVLFNDRYGLKRVYYHETAEAFYFASEAKSLLKVLPAQRRVDAASLGEFFSCGCALQNRSLFSGMSLLPGGSKWMFAQGQAVKKASYFRPETWESLPALGVEEYYGKLKETFSRVLPRYFVGGHPVGVSLTGGVDSRMVMAWAKPPRGALRTYTFGGMFRECGDVRIAREVARLCEQPHEVIPVGAEFLNQFPTLAEKTVFLSDGAMDVSGSPDLFTNRIARQISPVRMTGNYGGEILRSLVAFKPMRIDQSAFAPEFRPMFEKAAQTYATELGGCRRLSFVAFKQVPWHHFSRLGLEQSQLTLRSPYLDNELVALSFQVPPEHATGNALSLRLIHDGNPALAGLGTDRGLLHRSVPVVTSLQHVYQEFTFRAEYAYDYGMPDWLVRMDNALRPLHLERLFLGRHKFYHFRYWYRNQLASYLKAILLDARSLSRMYLNRRRVEQMVLDHTSGRRNHTLDIHRILTSELMHRQLIDQP